VFFISATNTISPGSQPSFRLHGLFSLWINIYILTEASLSQASSQVRSCKIYPSRADYVSPNHSIDTNERAWAHKIVVLQFKCGTLIRSRKHSQ
jgi:hypothetical protein